MKHFVITLTRQFASQGRSIAQVMSRELGINFYDRDIVEATASRLGLPVREVSDAEDTHSQSFFRSIYPLGTGNLSLQDELFQTQSNIIKDLAARESCIIVGRCADVILKDYHPLNLFVYADAESKIQRCIDRAPEGEHLSRNDIARRMKQVDKNRAQYRQMFADNKWGAKETYHLCVNTSGHQIKDLIPGLAAFVRCWYGEK